MNSNPSSPIIFFDGICHLCNGFVDFLAQKGRQKRLKFAPLQGTTAQQELAADQRLKLSTVIVKNGNEIMEKSDAVLFAVSQLGGAYKLVFLLRALPKSLRYLIYDYVAKNRYSWFGERDICRLPLPDEKGQLLP